MNHLELRPEIQMYPTWVERDGVLENASPDSLGISDTLSDALNAWADRWDSTYDLVNDPGNPKFESPTAEQAFWSDGRQLADRLRSELGNDWTVNFDSNGSE
ncbi:hypothetical protein D5S18_25700 [Nocardia panacis]|uniref:Uncharacterized protein n=1 Tax=Nocardia panacis TaxID=2340916 RepID=A0A3A4KDN9_9NOCA|nr:hypothetical protein [Nocardia panacis]RJO70619.1 hypothetical protein D5S18_25700 [Nocardia panacis]